MGVRSALRDVRADVARLEAANAQLTAAASAAGWSPVTAVTAGGTGDLWPATDRGAAMAVPVLAFIRHQLAGGVSSMALQRFRTLADGTEQLLPPGWCSDPDPAPTIPVSVFFAWVIDDLFFTGVSTLVVLARDATGFPVQFRRVLPGQLSYDPTTLAWGTWPVGPVTYRGQQIDPADVVTIAGPHEGLCNYGAASITAALALEVSAANTAAEPLPNIDLHQTAGEPLSRTAALELVNDWAAARQLGATAYTPPMIDAKPVGYSAAEQQLVEGRQYMATQLARLAGVNPVLVSAAMGSSSSYVYSNQGDYRAAFLDDVLDSYLRAIEGRLSASDVTPRGQSVRFDRDSFTRLTLAERATIMVGALKSAADPARVAQVADALGVDVDFAEV